MTYKSDDVVGRTKAYEAIVKGEKIPAPGLPESFRVLVKELQSLGLDMQVLDADDNVLELRELDDDTDPHNAEKVEVTVDMLEAKEAAVAQAIEERCLYEPPGVCGLCCCVPQAWRKS